VSLLIHLMLLKRWERTTWVFAILGLNVILICLNNSDFVFLGNQTTCYELPNRIRRKQIGGA
jgi:hypothetical protein